MKTQGALTIWMHIKSSRSATVQLHTKREAQKAVGEDQTNEPFEKSMK